MIQRKAYSSADIDVLEAAMKTLDLEVSLSAGGDWVDELGEPIFPVSTMPLRMDRESPGTYGSFTVLCDGEWVSAHPDKEVGANEGFVWVTGEQS